MKAVYVLVPYRVCERMGGGGGWGTVKNNLFIGNFYVFFPCRIYLKTLVLPLTH